MGWILRMTSTETEVALSYTCSSFDMTSLSSIQFSKNTQMVQLGNSPNEANKIHDLGCHIIVEA